MDDLTIPLPEPSRRSRRLPAILMVAGLTLMATLGFLATRDNARAALPAGATELLATQEGVIGSVMVAEGQSFSEGDLLLAFDDQSEQAELTAAHEALQALASEVKATDVAVAITPPEGVSGRIVPIGPLRPVPVPKVDPLPAPIEGPNPTLPAVGPTGTTVEPKPSAKAELEATIAAAETELAEAKTRKLNLEHQLAQLQSEAEDAQKNADAGKVIAQQRKQHADKMKMLLAEGAVSQLEATKADVQYASAQGGYMVAQEMADAAAKKLKDAEAEIAAASAQIPTLEKSIELQRDVLKKMPEPALSPTPELAPPLREVETRPVPKPATVQPAPLPNLPTKVDVDKGAIREADQLLAGAKERVDKAEAALIARRILAPRKGKVLKLLVKPGDRVKPGQVIAILL